MKIAATETSSQEARLIVLGEYDILDSRPEQSFDDIAALAAEICNAPIALVSLIDSDRQWFKARVGMQPSQTPLDKSICVHAIHADEMVEIPDTLNDARSSGNLLCVDDPGIRFYAGAQLRSATGVAIGMLCVLDYRPRRLTPAQRDMLAALARQVVTLLELRKALREAEVLRQEVDHRVKNSLQSVAALTRLHARSGVSEEVKTALGTVVRRIETVASLHEQLYRTNATDRIDLARYLTNVAGSIQGFRPDHVALKLDIEPYQLDSRRAAAVAVLVNEFIQNSITHAFPDARAGRIDVRGHRDKASQVEGGQYVLTLADDGIGFPVDHRRDGGLGLPVIEASCAQLGGTYHRLEAAQGTVAEVRIPLEQVAQTV